MVVLTMGNKIVWMMHALAMECYLQDMSSTDNLMLLDVVSCSRFLKSDGLVLVKFYFGN
jgi:hypothetical protein